MKSNHRQGQLSGMMAVALTMLAIVVMFAGTAVPAQAQTPTTLHGFQNVSTDACQPENNIVQGRDGNMYGVGLYCGTNNTGAVAAPPPPAAGGGYAVQVTSQRSEGEAQSAFRALQAKYPTQLGGRAPIIRRADLGEKGTFYRALVGPFGSAEEAAGLCNGLKAAGGNCIVQRN